MVSFFPSSELNNFNRIATEKCASKMNFHQATNKWVKIEREWERESERTQHKSKQSNRIMLANCEAQPQELELNESLSEFTLQAINLAAIWLVYRQ